LNIQGLDPVIYKINTAMPRPVTINLVHDPEFDDTRESLEFYSPSQAWLADIIEAGPFLPFGREDLRQDPLEFADTPPPAGPEGEGPITVTIETGYAFGDGRHATTWLCMKFLLDFLSGVTPARRERLSLLDAGAGTGILAIVAALHGVRDIDAVEIYHHAVLFAERNIRTNGCGWIRLHESGLEDFSPGRTYDIVTANLVSDVITANIGKLRDCIAPGGTLIASGVSAGRHGSMLELFGRSGLLVTRQEARDGWHGYVMVRDGLQGAGRL
jgi:ribosomal protein L11 methylase PrmA